MSSSPLRTVFVTLWLLVGLGNFSALAVVREIATVVTSEGTMEFELYRDSSQIAVANFKYMADSHFYDGTKKASPIYTARTALNTPYPTIPSIR